MWAFVDSETVEKVYTRPTAITVGDNQYPANVMTLWSDAQLKGIGVYRVIVDDSKKKDPAYYINTNQTFAFASNKVKATYGNATAKDLDDKTVDGVVTRGLKYNHVQAIDPQAYSLLLPSDWMVVKATETSGTVASDWTTYRAGVRTAAESMKAKINAVSDVDALAALYVYDDADPPVRPLGEFPTPPE